MPPEPRPADDVPGPAADSIAGFTLTQERDLNLLRWSAAGEWDLAQEAPLAEALDSVRADPPQNLVLDLRELSFIDSRGLQSVLELHRLCLECGVHLVILPGPPACQRVFELTGLADRLPFGSAGDAGPSA